MKKLLWIGNPFFRAELANLGWELVAHTPDEGEILTREDCLALCPDPDLLMVADMSRAPFVVGMEDFPCPTVFYAVDTHIHSWMPWYGQAFDACLLSLKDHIPDFAHRRLPPDRLFWFPPYAPALPPDMVLGRRDLDLVFIGRINPQSTPIRAAFLDELKGLVPGLVAQFGDFNKFFPRAKVVVNSCEAGDLNFRVFESLGLGAALVTPALGNGQAELFEEGRQLLTYPLDVSAEDKAAAGREAAHKAAPLILDLLDDDLRREAMGRAGFAEVEAKHRARHRAEQFLAATAKLTPDMAAGRRNSARFIRERFLRLVYLHWAESAGNPAFSAAYLKAARA